MSCEFWLSGMRTRARLLGERLEDRLAHPPHGVGDELHALVGIELPDRLEQSLVADRDELGEVEPVPLILLHVGDDEPEVRGHQPLGGRLVALLGAPGEAPFLGRIRDQRELLDVLQVLVERRGGRGAEETLGPGLGRMLHTHPGAALGSEDALWTRTSSRTCRRDGQDRCRYTRRSTPKSYASTPRAPMSWFHVVENQRLALGSQTCANRGQRIENVGIGHRDCVAAVCTGHRSESRGAARTPPIRRAPSCRCGSRRAPKDRTWRRAPTSAGRRRAGASQSCRPAPHRRTRARRRCGPRPPSRSRCTRRGAWCSRSAIRWRGRSCGRNSASSEARLRARRARRSPP